MYGAVLYTVALLWTLCGRAVGDCQTNDGNPLNPSTNVVIPSGLQTGEVAESYNCSVHLGGEPLPNGDDQLPFTMVVSASLPSAAEIYGSTPYGMSVRAMLLGQYPTTETLLSYNITSLQGKLKYAILHGKNTASSRNKPIAGLYDIARYSNISFPPQQLVDGQPLVFNIPGSDSSSIRVAPIYNQALINTPALFYMGGSQLVLQANVSGEMMPFTISCRQPSVPQYFAGVAGAFGSFNAAELEVPSLSTDIQGEYTRGRSGSKAIYCTTNSSVSSTIDPSNFGIPFTLTTQSTSLYQSDSNYSLYSQGSFLISPNTISTLQTVLTPGYNWTSFQLTVLNTSLALVIPSQPYSQAVPWLTSPTSTDVYDVSADQDIVASFPGCNQSSIPIISVVPSADMDDSLLSWGPYVRIQVNAYGSDGSLLDTPILTCNNYGGNPGPTYLVHTVSTNDSALS